MTERVIPDPYGVEVKYDSWADGWTLVIWVDRSGTTLPLPLRSEMAARKLAATLERILRPAYERHKAQQAARLQELHEQSEQRQREATAARRARAKADKRPPHKEDKVRFTFTVEVEVERSQGKFASKDELREQLQQALDDANPGNLEGDAGGEYEVSVWEVQ